MSDIGLLALDAYADRPSGSIRLRGLSIRAYEQATGGAAVIAIGTGVIADIGLGVISGIITLRKHDMYENVPANALRTTMNHFSPDVKEEYGFPFDAVVRFVGADVSAGNGSEGVSPSVPVTVTDLFPAG